MNIHIDNSLYISDYCLVYTTSTPTGPTSGCSYDGQVTFNNTEYSFDNNSLYSISGYVSVCVNGTPALVCGDASIGQTELTSICYQTAYIPCKLMVY